jgi:hypothetical protein
MWGTTRRDPAALPLAFAAGHVGGLRALLELPQALPLQAIAQYGAECFAL